MTVLGIRKFRRVLIVEDEPRLRDLLARAIGGWDFELSVARSGEEALRITSEMAPDIALLDINLPGMTGIELLERLRQRLPDLQAIILTGFGDLESARRAIHLDVVEFLTKPCHLGELEMALDRAHRRMKRNIGPIDEAQADGFEEESDGAALLADVERRHILAMLQKHNGNRTIAALELGISRRTLQYRISEYQRQGFLTE